MSSDIGTEAEAEAVAEAEVVRQFRAVAGGAAQPASERLYAGAVERGRRIRRARVIWRMLVGAAVVGGIVVGAVATGVPLLGRSSTSTASTSGTATTGVAASGTAAASAAPGAAHTKSAAGAGSDTSWMRNYTTRTFESLLPAGYSTAAWSQFGGVPFQVAAPLLGVEGAWEARVLTDLTTGAGSPSVGRSTTGLSVRASGTKAVCPSKVGAPYDSCTTVARDGGTVVVDLSFKNPVDGSGAKIWTVDWNGPDGQRVSFSEATAEPHQALTVQQAVALVTSPAWDRVWQALPAVCPNGAVIRPGATNAQLQDGTGLVCATSRSVAVPR